MKISYLVCLAGLLSLEAQSIPLPFKGGGQKLYNKVLKAYRSQSADASARAGAAGGSVSQEIAEEITSKIRGAREDLDSILRSNNDPQLATIKDMIREHDKNVKEISRRGNMDGQLTEREIFQLELRSSLRAFLVAKVLHFDKYVRVKSLKEIYSDKGYFGRSLEDISAVAARKDRVLVAVLDNGVDYNHPTLAYKVSRPDESEIAKLSQGELVHSMDIYRSRGEIAERIAALRDDPSAEAKREIHSLERELDRAKKVVHRSTVGWDFFTEDHLPYGSAADIYSASHGTFVSGVLVKDTDDIALLPIRRDSFGRKNLDEINFAAERGARIVNFSNGTNPVLDPSHLHSSDLIRNATFNKAVRDNPDILFVTAAGNDARNLDVHPVYPTAYTDLPNLLSVASVDSSNELHYFSNYGKKTVDVAALGGHVTPEPQLPISMSMVSSVGPAVKEGRIPIPGNRSVVGTSFAAPFVSRVAALVLSINPKLRPAQVIDIIKKSVTKVDALEDKIRFGGVVNEQRALELARESLNKI